MYARVYVLAKKIMNEPWKDGPFLSFHIINPEREDIQTTCDVFCCWRTLSFSPSRPDGGQYVQ